MCGVGDGDFPVAVEEKDIALRTLDPYYMERVGIFMKEVGKQLAPLQVNKGKYHHGTGRE